MVAQVFYINIICIEILIDGHYIVGNYGYK